ncbi:MAG TPA: enoyl-CoA hydratase/isomerase family protein [Natrialbaceae archaeon]|nr:enoyl-CoA hydratase/isomerase family protein [Natrialbaceae archaeon]
MHATEVRGVRTITFDRPDAMNAFTTDHARELAERIEAADPDALDAVVLTGEGRAFSAGGDVAAMAEMDERPDEAAARIEESFGRLAEAMLDAPVPIVARVNGDAVGAGLSVVGLSDFAYAVDAARFGAAFVKVGLIPDTGGTFLLPRLVGLRAAKRLVFTGELIDAEAAAELGLVNRAVAPDELDAAIDDLLETLRDRPTRTIGLAKRALHENLAESPGSALEYEALIQSHAYGTPEHEEGVRAFLGGRDGTDDD